MEKYPLEWGVHTDPNTDDDSSIPASSSPSTAKGYPLEFGWHVPNEPATDPQPAPPSWPTLLTGRDPDTSVEPPRVTPVQYSPEANTDGPQLAQAKPSARQPAPQPKPAAPWQPTPEEVIPGIEQNAKIWDDIVHAREGHVPRTVQAMLPDNWEQAIDKINPNYSKWTREAAQRNGIPPELLARMLWKESKYNAHARNPYTGAAGIAQLLPIALRELKIDPRNFSYSDPKSSIDAGAAYLGRLNGQFRDWPKSVAAYNWGEGSLKKWLNGWNGTDFITSVEGPKPETKATLYHVFRGNPNAFDR